MPDVKLETDVFFAIRTQDSVSLNMRHLQLLDPPKYVTRILGVNRNSALTL
jgi:hypothetical protein